jgi:hypothetical protein
VAASAGDDNTVRLWDLRACQQVRVLRGHIDIVRSVAFSRDGGTLLSGGAESTSRLWHLSRPESDRAFADRLHPVPSRLRSDGADPSALTELGQWYAFRGCWGWAAKLLEEARDRGATIPAVTLARSYWKLQQEERACSEFRKALAAREASETYLNLCIQATDRERSSAR